MASLKLSRAQLASFLKDPEQIKQFEKLFAQTNENTDTISLDLITQIGTAITVGMQALGEIEALKARLDHEPPIQPEVRTDDVHPWREPYYLVAGTGLDGGGSFGNNVTVDLADTAVTTAIYGSASEVGQFTVDQQGRITLAANVTITPAAIGGVPDSRTLTAGAGMTGGGDLSANRTFDVGAGTGITVNANDVAITDTGVSAAAYGSASAVGTFTVNAQGQLTAAADVAIAISAAAVTSGTLAVARGGTNIGSYTVGDILYASGATTLSALADVATGNALISGGVGVAPSWGKVGLTTHISGTLAVGNGGTGDTSFTANYLLKGNGSSALSESIVQDTGTYLRLDSGSGGIQFNGDTAAGNALDDYEEGTWTPVVADASTAGNVSPTAATSAHYTKIGNLVNVQCFIANIDTTGMTAGNDVYIRDLPFTAKSLAGTTILPGSVVTSDVTFTGFLSAAIFDNAAYIRLAESASGAGIDFVIVSELSSGAADIYINMTYFAA